MYKADAENKAAAGEAKLQAAAESYRRLGALAFLDDTAAALEAYEKAVDAWPDDIRAWNQLGQLLLRIGDSYGAEEAYQTVLELGEKQNDSEWRARAYNNLGIVYETQRHFDEAEARYRRALEIEDVLRSPKGLAATYGNLGNLFLAQDKLDQAEEFYNKALSSYE